MLCDRLHNVQPFLAAIDLVNLQKSLVHVWHRRYKRRSFSHGPPSGFPIERISPTIVRIAWAPAFFQNFKEMNSALVVLRIAESLRQESKAHRIVGVCYWKSLRLPEELPCRGYECLGEYHRCDSEPAKQRLLVVESLCATP